MSNHNKYLTSLYLNKNSQFSLEDINEPIYANCVQLVDLNKFQYLNTKNLCKNNKFNLNEINLNLDCDDYLENNERKNQKKNLPPPIRPRLSIQKKKTEKKNNFPNLFYSINNQKFDQILNENIYNDINFNNENINNDSKNHFNDDKDFCDELITRYNSTDFPPPLPPRKLSFDDKTSKKFDFNDINDDYNKKNNNLKFDDNFIDQKLNDVLLLQSTYGKIQKKSKINIKLNKSLENINLDLNDWKDCNQINKISISSQNKEVNKENKIELNNNLSLSSSNLSTNSDNKFNKKKLTKPIVEILSPLLNSLSKNYFSLDRTNSKKKVNFSAINQEFKSSLAEIDLILHSENNFETIPIELKKNISKSLVNQSILIDSSLSENEIFELEKDKTGFLYKAGTSRKQFNRRWCILNQNSFLYYNEQIRLTNSDIKVKTTPNGCIELNNIVFIGKIINNAFLSPNRFQKAIKTIKNIQFSNKIELFQFNIGTSIDNGRIYLFAAETEAYRKLWISSLASKIKPKFKNSKLTYNKVDACGFLNIKIGITGLWSKCWTVLKQRDFYLTMLDLNSLNGSCDLIIVDLRKTMIIGFNSNTQISNCETAYEDGPIFFLNRRFENTLYFQADYKLHTEEWLNLIKNNWILPENGLLEDQLLNPNNTPIAIEKCLNFISTYGNNSLSIYSNQGKENSVKIIFDNLKSNTLFNWHIKPEDGFTIFDVADALKKYLTSFPECILTEQLYPDFNKLYLITDHKKRIEQLKILLKKLPDVNFFTLKKLICHFNSILEMSNGDENIIEIDNLANIISPIILFSKISAKPDSKNAINLFKDLINSFICLFDVKTEEIEKERKIQYTLNEIRKNKVENKPNSEFLISVYLYSKQSGRCLNVPINSSMTADDMIFYASKIVNLNENPTKLAVFEVISNHQLERILHYSENILDITLSWTTKWHQHDAKDNYFLIKLNNFYDKIDYYLNQNTNISNLIPFTLINEVKFSDINQGRSFKKVFLELISNKFNIYKDLKTNKSLSTWLIEDIVWYLGSETKRNAPTKFCLTFLERYQHVIRTKESHTCIGKVVAFNTEEELNKWIARLINTEYPNGIYPLIHFINL